MIQSVNLPPSAHPVCTLQQIFSAHCSYTIQCTLQQISSAHCSKSSVHTAAILSSAHCSKSSVHTAAILSSAHCSKSPVHTAAILSSAHCSCTIQCTLQLHYLVPIPYSAHYIQCTFEPPQGKPIPLLAYLQNSQQTLMVDCSSPLDEEDWLFVAVH